MIADDDRLKKHLVLARHPLVLDSRGRIELIALFNRLALDKINRIHVWSVTRGFHYNRQHTTLRAEAEQ